MKLPEGDGDFGDSGNKQQAQWHSFSLRTTVDKETTTAFNGLLIECTPEELANEGVRQLCSNYVPTLTPTTIANGCPRELFAANTSICYSNGELSENIRNTLSREMAAQYCDEIGAAVPTSEYLSLF